MTVSHLSLWHGEMLVTRLIIPPGRVQTIKRWVADKHDLRVTDLEGRDVRHHVSLARHEAMYEIRRCTNLSLTAIGQRFGGRDHTTVLNAIHQHEKRIAEAGA